MHLHPTVGAMMLRIGKEFGLPAIRIPAEPPRVMLRLGVKQGLGASILYAWTELLRAQARKAGVRTNQHCFGLAWSGHMTADRVRSLLPHLPRKGLSEIYFHPATERDAVLSRLMPDYEHEAELEALLDEGLRQAHGPHRHGRA
jgi:hypothetical protein